MLYVCWIWIDSNIFWSCFTLLSGLRCKYWQHLLYKCSFIITNSTSILSSLHYDWKRRIIYLQVNHLLLMFVWLVCNETVIMLVCKPLTSHYSRVSLNRANVVMMISAQKSRHSLVDWFSSSLLHTWWLCCLLRSSIRYLTRQTLELFLSCRTFDPSSLSFPFSSVDRGLLVFLLPNLSKHVPEENWGLAHPSALQSLKLFRIVFVLKKDHCISLVDPMFLLILQHETWNILFLAFLEAHIVVLNNYRAKPVFLFIYTKFY